MNLGYIFATLDTDGSLGFLGTFLLLVAAALLFPRLLRRPATAGHDRSAQVPTPPPSPGPAPDLATLRAQRRQLLEARAEIERLTRLLRAAARAADECDDELSRQESELLAASEALPAYERRLQDAEAKHLRAVRAGMAEMEL
jgi:septal ring factor EnvC (AmiA/AmiB activator)